MAQYKVLKSGFFISERGTVIPAVREIESGYKPKLFPREYKIYFDSKKAFHNFLEESSIIKEKKGPACHEYVVYKGETVLHKVYSHYNKCLDEKIDDLNCQELQRHNELSEDFKVSYKDALLRNCLAHLVYVGETINNQNNQVECIKKEVDFKEKPYPTTDKNKSMRSFYYITNQENFFTINKELYPNDYFKKEDFYYFETEKAYKSFKKNSTSKFILKKGFQRQCINEIRYNSFVIERPAKRNQCY